MPSGVVVPNATYRRASPWSTTITCTSPLPVAFGTCSSTHVVQCCNNGALPHLALCHTVLLCAVQCRTASRRIVLWCSMSHLRRHQVPRYLPSHRRQQVVEGAVRRRLHVHVDERHIADRGVRSQVADVAARPELDVFGAVRDGVEVLRRRVAMHACSNTHRRAHGRTHNHTRTRTRTRTHAHRHTLIACGVEDLCRSVADAEIDVPRPARVLYEIPRGLFRRGRLQETTDDERNRL